LGHLRMRTGEHSKTVRMPQRDLDVKTQETRKLFIEIYTLIEEARPRADTAAVTFQVVRG
jgi:hypothetical protein